MLKCEECGKKIGIFRGYKHPTMGKKHSLCSNCFDYVNKSVTKWQKFILANSFNGGKTNYNFYDIVSNFSGLNNDLKNISAAFSYSKK
ncbi:hypothetical protein AYK24_08945 [Thermoplasmatales archaeon SG8-52-4]|nr:MAG: hypothetical protein AYK24_08945 [Thermoplasmatales archaeon SG8-52-4]